MRCRENASADRSDQRNHTRQRVRATRSRRPDRRAAAVRSAEARRGERTLARVDTGRDVAALLADVARIGPFFTVGTGPAPAGDRWTTLHALAAPPDAAAADPLRDRIRAVGAALGTDARVAASTAFQGLAAQVVSPLLAAVAVHGVLPAPAGGVARALLWRPGGAGPWLWWAGPGGRVVPCPDAALGDVLTGVLAPLAAAVRARASVSPRVLWGDVASAVATARRLVAADRPGSAARATAVAERLLAAPPLAVTAALRAPEPPDARWTFRRRSCCLYYRVPGGGLCGDCVLHDRVAADPGAVRAPAGGRNHVGRLA
jgi:hypothetical protein